MVKVWAEKEMRNLKRMYSAGIPCPLPVALKNHVLIMSLIGEGGQAAPRLKNAELNASQMRDAYGQLVLLMRKLFHTCRLIHADLSEYNILYFQGKLFIIDVSQSVEHDHPHSMEFLKKDVENMTRYFQQGVSTHRKPGREVRWTGRAAGWALCADCASCLTVCLCLPMRLFVRSAPLSRVSA